MPSQTNTAFNPVYGPVSSWRYGTSLGIDPIGSISTCSFDCVYCQLGAIEQHIADRKIYVPTSAILESLQTFAPWEVDVITLSGSGEPTLAANLGEILQGIKALTQRPTLVLSNGTLLRDPEVRHALGFADAVSLKLDALNDESLARINRPVAGCQWQDLWQGLQQFRAEYSGKVGIQTMVLKPWPPETVIQYSQLMRTLQPDEIQLNTPTRPKPKQRQLEGRGNHPPEQPSYEVQYLKCVSPEILDAIATDVERLTHLWVRTVQRPQPIQ